MACLYYRSFIKMVMWYLILAMANATQEENQKLAMAGMVILQDWGKILTAIFVILQ